MATRSGCTRPVMKRTQPTHARTRTSTAHLTSVRPPAARSHTLHHRRYSVRRWSSSSTPYGSCAPAKANASASTAPRARARMTSTSGLIAAAQTMTTTSSSSTAMMVLVAVAVPTMALVALVAPRLVDSPLLLPVVGVPAHGHVVGAVPDATGRLRLWLRTIGSGIKVPVLLLILREGSGLCWATIGSPNSLALPPFFYRRAI
jgi:hypothetical protein